MRWKRNAMLPFAIVMTQGAYGFVAQRSQSNPWAISMAKSTRRKWLSSWTLLIPIIAPAQAFYVDLDRYGDKELKVALVNKVRQNIRDVLMDNPSLAPDFLEIVLQDALTYDAISQQGGADGSIVAAILAADSNSPLGHLKGASNALQTIQSKNQRATEISVADVVTIAGAEAIETAGGPHVTVQLGKIDPTIPYPAVSYPDLNNPQQTLAAFHKAGLTVRDVTIMLGGIAAIQQVVESQKSPAVVDFEENEMGDPEVVIPSSFGAPREIYGTKFVGTLENDVFRKNTNPLLSDASLAEWTSKYGNSQKDFLKDLCDGYRKAVGQGKLYTGGKNGQGENDLF